jgi:hypothetical protein
MNGLLLFFPMMILSNSNENVDVLPSNSSAIWPTRPREAIRVDAPTTTNYTQTMEYKKSSNARFCTCTYPGCEKHGICCECLHYHLGLRQLPACCFPKDVERTYDRTFERFAGLVSAGQV